MLAFLGTLFGLLIPAVDRIGGKIADAKVAQANAITDQERIAAEERVKTLEARRDVLVAESGLPINTIVRLLFALPPAIYLAKLYVYDKVLGLGATDPLSPELWDVLWTVIAFYFLSELGSKAARIFKR